MPEQDCGVYQLGLGSDSLGDLTPWEYLAKHSSLENSNYVCN